MLEGLLVAYGIPLLLLLIFLAGYRMWLVVLTAVALLLGYLWDTRRQPLVVYSADIREASGRRDRRLLVGVVLVLSATAIMAILGS